MSADMRLRASPVFDPTGKMVELTVRFQTPKTINAFRTALNRALNCWPEAPAELKELSDMLEHGRILQDYRSQHP